MFEQTVLTPGPITVCFFLQEYMSCIWHKCANLKKLKTKCISGCPRNINFDYLCMNVNLCFSPGYPFMPTSSHNMPADLSPASYAGGGGGAGGHMNNISPNALSNYHRGPMVCFSLMLSLL